MLLLFPHPFSRSATASRTGCTLGPREQINQVRQRKAREEAIFGKGEERELRLIHVRWGFISSVEKVFVVPVQAVVQRDLPPSDRLQRRRRSLPFPVRPLPFEFVRLAPLLPVRPLGKPNPGVLQDEDGRCRRGAPRHDEDGEEEVVVPEDEGLGRGVRGGGVRQGLKVLLPELAHDPGLLHLKEVMVERAQQLRILK